MPLPSVRLYGAKICQCLSKRTKLPCNNVAAFGTKACRMHGAHRKHARLSGQNHPNFKHGMDSKQAKDIRAKVISELNYAFHLIMSSHQKQSTPAE